MITSLNSRWVTNLSSGKGKVRLFCFPYAGGGSVGYYPWRDGLRPEIELVLVHLPGREQRLRESLLTRFEMLVEMLADELSQEIEGKPFSFFGHSMGSLVAFEVARELRRRYNRVPRHLFLSGFRGAHLKDPDEPCSDLPEVEFIESLLQYEGIPEMIINNEELKELFLPILRADFKILETYTYKEDRPLDCPITVFGGLSDPKFHREDIDQWGIHTSAQFNAHYLPGGHFFLHDCKSQIINYINHALAG
jgi:medium-chain acyl-[acyl-carrier-protein] hydrolase